MNYDSIINLPHHVSKRRNKMSIENRSAQFAPFDALAGFSDEIKETIRKTENKIILTPEMKEKINNQLVLINNDKTKNVRIVYFIKDNKKDGGSYKSIITYIKKIDTISKQIILPNNSKILLDDIIDIKVMI